MGPLASIDHGMQLEVKLLILTQKIALVVIEIRRNLSFLTSELQSS